MEHQNTAPQTIQDASFKKRRNQKNWIVLGLIAAGVALVWSVTIIKIQNGMNISHPIGLSAHDAPQKAPQAANEGGANAQ